MALESRQACLGGAHQEIASKCIVQQRFRSHSLGNFGFIYEKLGVAIQFLKGNSFIIGRNLLTILLPHGHIRYVHTSLPPNDASSETIRSLP